MRGPHRAARAGQPRGRDGASAFGGAAVEGIDMSAFDTAVDLNLRTVLVTTEAAIPELRRRGGGVNFRRKRIEAER